MELTNNKMSLRICIVSEAIKAPFDEGVKLFVYNLIKEFSRKFEVMGIGGQIISEVE